MREGWKDTELGLIPVDWEQSILSEYAEKPQYGFTDSSSNSGNAKFLRITDITDTGVNWNDVPYCNCPDVDKYKLVDGDIVFARIGATTGKSYIIKNPPKAVFASYLIRVRTRSKLLSDYLIYFFNSEYYWEQINSQKGNNLKGGVNGSILSDLKIIVPPTPEQRKIAYVLSTVQKAIEQQDKLIRHTTELKKALMQKLFTEGIGWLSGAETRQKQTEIGQVPESWEVKSIGDCLEKTKLKDPTKHPNEEFIYVDVSSVNNELFKVTEATKLLGKDAPSRARKLIQTDDVIFATVRPTLKRIAKITEDLNNQVCSTGFCVLKPIKSKLNTEFLYQYLQMDDFIARIEKLQRGASYPAVRDSDVKGMKIPIPKYNEQVLIGNYLKTLDLKKNLANSKKQTLSDLFKTMLHELMTGERRVHEIEFEKVSEPLMMND
ncbi:MAG TPA: restriction endonuclease subunit S [Cyclobacteriaceae bacterium]|nr:restriction endonuclease subunit S [Cyclobacteriaceae bacterium]HRJ80676.1 restriction endonuclease subunit S [Cyclobacteriaceae bacterium]